MDVCRTGVSTMKATSIHMEALHTDLELII